MNTLNTGFSVLVALLLTLLHHGHVSANTTADIDVTPTVTATPSVTVTPTDMPSVTPTDAPSVTPTETPSITPSVTPSATPSVVPTGDEDGDKDDMLGLGAKIRAFFGLSNAFHHHEINEERFLEKHGHERPGEKEGN